MLKSIIFTLPLAFLLFGAPKNNNNSYNQLKIHHQADSCCKNCGSKNCSCCDNHKKSDDNDSDNCSCQVSKDMDDKPSSLPESFNLTDYYFIQSTIVFPADSISKYFARFNINFSNEYYYSFKAETSTVIRI